MQPKETTLLPSADRPNLSAEKKGIIGREESHFSEAVGIGPAIAGYSHAAGPSPECFSPNLSFL